MTKRWPPTPAVVKELKKVLQDDTTLPKGWRTKTLHRIGGDLVFYIHRPLELVLKAPSVLYDPPPPKEMVVPTIQLGGGWVLQPLCKFDDRVGAFHTLIRKIGEKERYKWDLHLWNVGRFRGKPVFFDW
jgi:hypothetical protein